MIKILAMPVCDKNPFFSGLERPKTLKLDMCIGEKIQPDIWIFFFFFLTFFEVGNSV